MEDGVFHNICTLRAHDMNKHTTNYALLKTVAVRENGLNLRFFRKNQTPDICLLAVQQNGLALDFVNDQTPIIVRAALEQNPSATRLVRQAGNDPDNRATTRARMR